MAMKPKTPGQRITADVFTKPKKMSVKQVEIRSPEASESPIMNGYDFALEPLSRTRGNPDKDITAMLSAMVSELEIDIPETRFSNAKERNISKTTLAITVRLGTDTDVERNSADTMMKCYSMYSPSFCADAGSGTPNCARRVKRMSALSAMAASVLLEMSKCGIRKILNCEYRLSQ